TARQAIGQRLPFHELHGAVGLAVFFPKRIDSGDVRMVELSGKAGFALESLDEGRVVAGAGAAGLDRHRTLAFEGRSAVRLPHGSVAEELMQLEMRKPA